MLGLAEIGAGATTASSAPATHSRGASSGVTAKPTGGLALGMASAPGTPSVGEQSTASLHVSPEVGFSQLAIAITTVGPVSAAGPASQVLTSPAAGESVDLPIRFVVTGEGAGEVRARVTALDGAGHPMVSRSTRLWVETRDGRVFQSTRGSLDAAESALSSARDTLPAGAYAAQLDDLLGGGAVVTTSKKAASAPNVVLSAGGTVTISGQVRYTDSAGNTHPVRLAPVEIRDAEAVGSELVTTVTTSATGNYTATVDNDDGTGEGDRDLFIRVLAKSTGFDIQGTEGTHRIDSSVNNDVADGAALTVNLTANNVDDNNTAFAVHDALVTTVAYAATLAGGALPAIVVDFPTADETSNFGDGALHILQLDRFDWDVNLHEFGHYFMSNQGIEDNPGGSHSSSDNLSEQPDSNKDLGTRLAWGEGFPTYFGTSLQQVMGTAAFGIPNVGDTYYTDTEDSTLEYDLEGPSGGTGLGEDNELTVQRALWDLYDATPDTGDTRGVAFGDVAVFSPLKASSPFTLSEAYAALVAGRSASALADIGCIFSAQAVAPRITAPADNSPASASSPPTVTWSAQGGGPAFRNNRFIVRFYDATLATLLFQSPEQSGTRFTPAAAQWTSIRSSAGSLVNIVVAGRQTDAPATGPYTSCNIRLTVTPTTTTTSTTPPTTTVPPSTTRPTTVRPTTTTRPPTTTVPPTTASPTTTTIRPTTTRPTTVRPTTTTVPPTTIRPTTTVPPTTTTTTPRPSTTRPPTTRP